MKIPINIRQAYAEIDEFLNLISKEKREQIPESLRNLFKEEKDKNYKKHIVSTKSVEEQGLMEETLGIIALLNLKYWCNDESEKERLIEKYIENDKV